MFTMKNKREFSPAAPNYDLTESSVPSVTLNQISVASGKHTIVRAKKRRPTVQHMEEASRVRSLKPCPALIKLGSGSRQG